MKANLKTLFAFAFAGLLLVLSSSSASAQTTFSVDPLLIELDGRTNSTVLTLTNPTTKEIRFEIKAFAWDQAPPDRAMELTPSADVVIFPPLVSVKPNMTQRVRVGTTAARGAVEKSYRLMIEELPTGSVASAGNQVAIRTRIGIPVFVAPAKVVRTAGISNISVTAGTVSVTVANTGTTRVMVDKVVVRGMVGPDEQSFERSIQGWYLLAGKTRTWTYPFEPAQCRTSKYIEVEAFGPDPVLKSRVDVPAGTCNP